jgi:DNA primase
LSLFTADSIDRVRDTADIVEVVSAYTDLRRQGERFTGLCPFHDERTPSFSVKPAEGFYYCFGCEAGGDTIRFVMEKEGLSFPDAVEALADRFGVDLDREEEDPEAEARRRRRGRLGEALDRASAFYEAYLWEADKAARARAYLKERGLREEILRAFGVGFAPSNWDSILLRGQRAGFSLDELHAAGLVQQNQKGQRYDAFRSRITFPVRDVRGRTVGFGARASLPDQKPKYKNSAEGELYRKSRTLYGIDRARAAIARGERAVVVEGYTDVLALHQAGIEETVAVMGTAITSDQLKLLSQFASEVVLALDADRAGREAMLRAQRVAGSGKLRLLVVAMPEGEDPAEMLAVDGGEERFRRLLTEAVDLPVFHVRAILGDADLSTPAGRDRALDEVAPVLKAMGETITRQELVSEVADRLETDPGMVARRLAAAPMPSREEAPRPEPVRREPDTDAANAVVDGDPGPEEGPATAAPAGPRTSTVEEKREDAFLAMCISQPSIGAEFIGRLEEDDLVGPRARSALPWLREHLEAPLEGLPREDDELFAAVTSLTLLSEEQSATPELIADTWRLLQLAGIDRELGEIKRALRDGGGQAEQDRFRELVARRAETEDAVHFRPT